MDINPYFKEIATLLRKAAERVRVARIEKMNELPRLINELDSEKSFLQKQKHNLEAKVVQHAQKDDNSSAVMAMQAKEMRDEEKSKDEQKRSLTEQYTQEVNGLEALEKQLFSEADDYERRTI